MWIAIPDLATKQNDPASSDTGSFSKRAKGVEPSTFTLATFANAAPNNILNQPLTISDTAGCTTNAQWLRLTELNDPALHELIRKWPGLPLPLKKALMAAVRVSSNGEVDHA
jgi:hypothetical protein